ncbi:hypothetical protein SODALDRAFT_340692 [Sodiomyces alkalinus F11]|uniref:Uncharacterized protein n=1 Tax=Sodiomyces alkalinus (strain CBS 110278 / VKM F-3762 / F11) TaxID=1314773 RepID=A0A3N2PSA5_SODAK|nr:hypothetical protein SODALDRAFT_340692 [Sodiomyces alkalinus F11]ROT37387.1 hypothetical protein SODALDRAFT_340692 [Sodiomyces alkalinus F11]
MSTAPTAYPSNKIPQHPWKFFGAIATTLEPDLRKLCELVRKSRGRFLSTDGIPTPQLILAALRTCQGAANAIHPYLAQIPPRSPMTASTASNLLSLDLDPAASGTAKTTASANAPALVRDAIECVSTSAYAIVAHPPVFITPEVLDLYVTIQARLGRPETLPDVLELFASKPKPRVVDGAISYEPQNPKRADRAIQASTAEAALNCAIEARDLDAALGVIEACYTTEAFVRQKLLKKAFLPVSVFGAAPFAAYGLAATLSTFQNTIEPATATKYAFAGVMAYVGFTATIGMVAAITANDQMKRVTWAPGTPLHTRWLREEERVALDDVACAWGFKEKWRHGEEAGPEWDGLREYLGLKGMILDRVEFMEGMS